MITEVGPVELDVPRDRDASFEPKLVRKRQRRLGGIDQMVISLTAKGLTTGGVQAHLAEVYGTDVSRETSSRITDAVVADMEAWQSRPLDAAWLPGVVANPKPKGSHAEVRVEQELAGDKGSLLRADPAGLVWLESLRSGRGR